MSKKAHGKILRSENGLFVLAVTCFVPAVQNLGKALAGRVLLVATWVLVTLGFFLTEGIRKKWRRGGLAIALSFSLGCLLLVVGYMGGRPATSISPTVARPGVDSVVPAEGRTHQPQPPLEPRTASRAGVKSPVPSQAPLIGPGAKVVQDSRNAVDSPNVIAGGDVTINPPANTNEWTVRYEFNGRKHKQRVGEITMEDGEVLVFQKIKSLYDAQNWKSLVEVCEAETRAVPEWLTPYLYAGVGYGNLGERERAIQYLEYVEKHAAGDPMYADATRLLKQLRERQ